MAVRSGHRRCCFLLQSSFQITVRKEHVFLPFAVSFLSQSNGHPISESIPTHKNPPTAKVHVKVRTHFADIHVLSDDQPKRSLKVIFILISYLYRLGLQILLLRRLPYVFYAKKTRKENSKYADADVDVLPISIPHASPDSWFFIAIVLDSYYKTRTYARVSPFREWLTTREN